MKLMKKLLVLALAVATILMVACDNGNGGGGTSSSETDGNGGGTSTGSDTFVPPTLPESKGTDPFAGLKTLTTDTDERYQVDTTKKILTAEFSDDGTTWSKSAEYSYSYDSTANPLTITGRIEAQYEKGKRVTPAEALAADEDEFKAGFTQEFEETFDQLSGLDADQKNAQLPELNERYGLTLTVADLAADNKAATLEKVWNSKTVQDMLKEQQDTLKKEFSMTPTYAVTLTKESGTTAKITVEGQYDSKLAWHEQTAGSFVGINSDGKNYASFSFGGGIIYVGGDGDGYTDTEYTTTEYTTNSITCINDRDGTSKTFSYTTAGTDEDTVVTITVEAGKTIECTWQPSTIIGQ